MITIASESNTITVGSQKVLKALTETTVLVSIQATGLMHVIPNEDVTKTHSFMTAPVILNVYTG